MLLFSKHCLQIIDEYVINYFSDGVESPETSYKEEREYKHK